MDYRTVAAAQPYRGIRDNNPGNLQPPPGLTNWQGAVGADGPFVIFADTTWGLRAMAVDLTNKINSDGLNTITEIITAYAPPSENDTADYITAVVSDSGYEADEVLQADPGTLASLIRAIVNHEEGDGPSSQFVSDVDIQTGIQMAGDPSTVFSATAVQVEAYPTQSVLIIAFSVLLLYFMFRKK